MERKLFKDTIEIPIFNHAVTFITCSYKNLHDYLVCAHNRKDICNILSNQEPKACCTIIGEEIYLWWNGSIDMSVLSHEICHVVYAIMRHRGLSLTDEEAFCYLVEYITRIALCILHEQTEVINLQ